MTTQGKSMAKRILKKDQVGQAVGQSVGLVARPCPALARASSIDPHPPLPAPRGPRTPTPPGGHPPAPTPTPAFPPPLSLFGTRPGMVRENRDPGSARDGVGGCTHA